MDRWPTRAASRTRKTTATWNSQGPLDGDAPSSSASRAAPVSAFFVLVPIGLMSLFRVFRAVLRHVVTTLSGGRMLVITMRRLTVVA
jgi:hypothetical protein